MDSVSLWYAVSVFSKQKPKAENEYSFAVYDKFPVSEGHTLVVPKQEIADLFELSQEEYVACFKLVKQVRKILIDVYQPQGFNIGVNNSPVAGQTIPHAHIHIIPRYEGDVENPRGGIRNIIPGKGDY